MKKSIVMIATMALSVLVFAQKQPKPKINKANIAREKGDLALAKEIIDQATTYSKTKDDAKTWYYRGLIYATLDTSSNPQYASLSENALEIAMKSFEKSDELAGDKELYVSGANGLPVTKTQQVGIYYSYYFNSAVEDFQAESYQSAIDKFYAAAVVVEGDTNSYKNAAYAAHNGGLYEQAVKAYRKSIDAGAQSKDLYQNLSNILMVEIKDNEAALAVVQEALEIFPGEPTFSKTEINLLITMNKAEEAKENLIKAVEEEPENTSLQFALASMYEQLEQEDEALKTYSKCIEIDPDNFNCNFNKGVILLNRANAVVKEISNLGVSSSDKNKEKQLQPVMKEKLNAALPQWEKLYELKPEDRQVVETLAYIYNRLKRYDEADELMEILKTIPKAE